MDLVYISCVLLSFLFSATGATEATNVIYDYIDVTLPATTVTSNTIPTEPNTAYATTLRQTNAIKTDINEAYDVLHSSPASYT